MSRLVSFTGGDWHSGEIWELHGFCAKPVDLITSAFQLTSQAWVCKFFKPCSAWDFFWNNISSHILSSFAFGLYCNWWWSMRLAITCEFCWGWSSSRSWYEPAPLRSRSPSQVSKTWSGWHQESLGLGLDQDDQDHFAEAKRLLEILSRARFRPMNGDVLHVGQRTTENKTYLD